ncbi:uncharacterized protein [Venturia canescens]|uniref:uncharacterized protein n=1 Tax=Venturia canescens TaxID=32260 RepID=UPI001C9C811E|nr:uncharacterized protein LOC122417572 [Venturia canescens]
MRPNPTHHKSIKLTAQTASSNYVGIKQHVRRNEAIKHKEPNNVNYIKESWSEYTASRLQGHTPSDWSKSEIVLLYKKGDVDDPLNYRGIALANTIAKLFTTIIAKRVQNWCEIYDILPEAQAGFRPGRSCEDNIFILHAKIGLALSKPKGKLFIAFIDFRRAFDSVSHGILWEKLHAAGISTKIIKVMQNIYNKASFKIKANQFQRTSDISITQGVLQGDPASPILFSLLLADICHYFMDHGHERIKEKMELLLFADDIVLMADDVIELQNKMTTLEHYCNENQLEVNTQKTKVMICQKAGRRKKIRPIRYQETEIEIVDKYTYLGVPFTKSGLYNTACKSFMSKAKIALGTIWGPMITAKVKNWNARIKLFEAVVKSTLLYASNIWGLRHYQELDKIQLQFYKSLLAVPQCTPGYLIRLETGSTTISIGIIKKAMLYIKKILQMKQTRYPKIVLDQLIALDLADNNRNKYNWFSNLKETINRVGTSDILNNISPNSISEKLEQLLNCIKEKQFRSDVIRTLLSTYSPFYKHIKQLNESEFENYLKTTIPLPLIRLVAQIRLAGRGLLSIRYKKLQYKIDEKNICIICNKLQPESIEHFLNECPIYEPIRAHYLPTANPLLALENLDGKSTRKLAYYIIGACKLRAFTLEV